MQNKCVNCGGTEIGESESYPGVSACIGCGFLIAKLQATSPNIIMPEDPNDAMLCEGCQ